MPFSKFLVPDYKINDPELLEKFQRLADSVALFPDCTANIDTADMVRPQSITPCISVSPKPRLHIPDIEASRKAAVSQFHDQRLRNDERQKEITKQAYLEALREHEAEKQVKRTQRQTEAVVNGGKRKAGDADKARTEHAKAWVKREKYTGNLPDIKIITALQEDNSDLWGSNDATFRKWIQNNDEAKALFPNRRRK